MNKQQSGADKMLKAALADFSKLPHVEFDHWTTDCIASMVDQAGAQIDLVSEAIADPVAAGYEATPADLKKLRAFVRKWSPKV